MTTTTHPMTAAPSRTPLLAALGLTVSSALTAVGTFWAVNDGDNSDHSASDWLVTVGIAAVATAIVFGLVVRTAASGNPGRRAIILGVVALLSDVVFWAGLPAVLATGALACALTAKDQDRFTAAPKVALALAGLTVVGAVNLAILG
jgi:hypothetical protein